MTQVDIEKGTVQRHFDTYAADWHERFSTHPFRLRFEAVRDLVKNVRFTRVLDIGCGTGDYTALFENDPCVYLGIDISEPMIDRCRDLFPRFAFQVGDGDTLDVESAAYDLVLDIGVIEYYENPQAHIDELLRVTNRGGHIMLAGPNGYNITKGINDWVGRLLARIGIGRRSLSTKNPIVKNRGQTVQGVQAMLHSSGARVVHVKYSACLVFPEVLPFVGNVNLWISRIISNVDALKLLSKWSATTIVMKILR